MTIAAAFVDACRQELSALKPGNVHVYGDGHGMTTADFERSADIAAPHLCRLGAKLGQRILDAVTATRAAVGQNTNLGIILLCAPLAMAAERGGDLRAETASVLRSADLADTLGLFAAIARADPGGLGEAAEHDVRRPPSVTPLVAMRAAAHRDSIARQWANDFADVFGCGLWEYAHALERWDDASWATTATYLRFMSQFPDSHVLRKYGMHVARDAQRRATELHADLWRCSDPIEVQPRLIAWDMGLKVHGHNPGTSADLTVATLFAFRCT